MDDPIHMLTFARVVEARGFAHAARRLGLTASVASKHVAKLEQSLGARLLNRSTRALSLTEAGQAVYQHCAQLAAQLDAVERSLAQVEAQPQGLLRVSAPPAIIALQIAPALAAFRQRCPGLALEFDLSGRVVDFSDESCDLALRVIADPGAGLSSRLLAPLRIGLVASPEYLHRHGVPDTPAALRGHACLLLSQDAEPERWTLLRNAERATVEVRGALRCNVMEPLHRMALQGLGIARLPTFMTVPDVRAGRLVPVLRAWRQANDTQLWAVWPRHRDGVPKIRRFVDFLAQRFQDLRERQWAPSRRAGP